MHKVHKTMYLKKTLKLILQMRIDYMIEYDSSSMLIKIIWNFAQEARIANKTYYKTVPPTKCGN